MDKYEKWGYSLLAIAAAIYLIVIFAGMIAVFPYGLLGILVLGGFSILVIKVIKERLRNKEDDHYSNEVEK